MRQILKVIETNKETADYNRGLHFLEKQVWDNKRGVNTTTDGNDLRRFEKNVAYWNEKLLEYVAVRKAVEKSQNEVVEQFNLAEDKETECKECHGAGQIYVYQDDGYGNKEAVDTIDCVCQID